MSVLRVPLFLVSSLREAKRKPPMVVGGDSVFIIFNHGSFHKPDLFPLGS